MPYSVFMKDDITGYFVEIAKCKHHTHAMLIFNEIRSGYVVTDGELIAKKRVSF